MNHTITLLGERGRAFVTNDNDAAKLSLGYEKNFLITMMALVFVILKHSLQWRGEFHLYLSPVPEYLLVNSAARRFLMAAGVEGKFSSIFLYFLAFSLTIFGGSGIWADNLCSGKRTSRPNEAPRKSRPEKIPSQTREYVTKSFVNLVNCKRIKNGDL